MADDSTTDRRGFLKSLGKWSAAAIAAVLLRESVTPTEASGWVNRRGSCVNGGGGGWANRGGAWINGGGGWINSTDAEREWAYDRESHIGKLDKALDEATSRKWIVVDMKQDWKTIFR